MSSTDRATDRQDPVRYVGTVKADARWHDGRLRPVVGAENRHGGGAMHFCGKCDHYIPVVPELKGLRAVNMSQPHLNDVEKVYRNTVDRGILLLDMTSAETTRARGAGRRCGGRLQTFGGETVRPN